MDWTLAGALLIVFIICAGIITWWLRSHEENWK